MKPKSTRPRISMPGVLFALILLFVGAQTMNAQTNTLPESGNVGINTTSPGQPLSVNGNIEIKGNNGVRYVITDQGIDGKTRLVFQAGYGSTAVGAALNLWGVGNEYKSGWATIGLPSEAADKPASRFTINNLGLADGNDIFTVLRTGKVGIGTSSPTATLDLSNGPSSELRFGIGNGYQQGVLTTSVRQNYDHILFGRNLTGDSGSDNYQTIGSSGWGYSGIEQRLGGDLFFYAQDGTTSANSMVTPVSRLAIQGSSGNVGIGTPTPGSYRLNVNGDTNVSGNLNIVANGASAGNIVAAGTIHAKYQDVAEWVPTSEKLVAATVVVLDSTKSNQVISSTQAYDMRVAGVVSERPGIALGEKSDTKVLVATTGRVKVKVDASKSPIHIGDLLVTSDVPGVAMKSEAVNLGGVQFHRPGTLLGKALEPLEKGKGEILVLLSLQ